MDAIDLGPPVFIWRDDALFNQGYVAAELAIGALRELEAADVWEESNAEHAIEQLEAFLAAAREEAAQRARDSGSDPEGEKPQALSAKHRRAKSPKHRFPHQPIRTKGGSDAHPSHPRSSLTRCAS